MLRASLKSVLGRKLRLLMSAIAVVLGVAFVAGSFVFTDTLERSFAGLTSATVGDVVVRPAGAGEFSGATTSKIPRSVVDQLATVPGAKRADGNVMDYTTFVVSTKGKLVGGQGAPGIGTNYTGGPSANGAEMFVLKSGAVPTKDGEVVLDERTAKAAGYAVGDSVKIVTAGAQAQVDAKLVGTLTANGSLLGSSVVLWNTHQAQTLYTQGKDVFTDVWVTRDDGTSQEELRSAVTRVLPQDLEALTGQAAAKETQDQVQEGLQFITYFLLIFAAVALVVGTFLIVNTFSILVAQRMKELALFRAIGASRRQVARSVLVEAVIVGLVGATLGLGVGVLLAIGIKALFATFGLDLSGSALVIAPRTIIASYAVGLLVTVFAAYLPARKAGRVPPVAAMRDDVTLTETSMHRRVIVGAVLAVIGAVSLGIWLFADPVEPMIWVGAGILGVLLGVAATSPLVGRPLILGLGRIYRRLFGSVGVMAEENALRNPRRTAATASALMIGVTLVSMMAVFGGSAKASIKDDITYEFTADYLVSNAVGQDFSASIGDEIATLPEVGTLSRVRWGQGKAEGESRWVAAIDPATFPAIRNVDLISGSLDGLASGGVILDQERAQSDGRKLGDSVPIQLQDKEFSAKVVGIAETGSLPGETVLGLETWNSHGGTQADAQLYLLAKPGTQAALGTALDRVVDELPMVSVKDMQAYAQERSAPIDQMLAIIYALLGLAVVIAILGIINTLALSVIERTREIGLLRAIGLSRRQLRTMLRLESVAISVLGAVLGIVLGVLFGTAIQRALTDQGFTTLRIPWLQLALFLLLAGVVGVFAALWPGRRAARMQVLDAIATE